MNYGNVVDEYWDWFHLNPLITLTFWLLLSSFDTADIIVCLLSTVISIKYHWQFSIVLNKIYRVGDILKMFSPKGKSVLVKND